MSSSQKRGFRLPWAGERSPGAGDAATTLDAAAGDATGAERDLGSGPFRLADATQPMTTDAAPAAPDVPDSTPEAAMLETDAPTTEPAAAPPASDAEAGAGWPTADRRDETTRPFVRAEHEPRMPRRDNPLVAGLIKAMREAAVASRAETTMRLEAEAAARVESIKARSASEAGALRKQADEDVAGIREWSKTEIARIRQATEGRIEGRKADLAGETERHAAGVTRLVDEVQTTVAAFEAEMDHFFERLLAEDDPARLATLAEQAPDPPDLSGDGPPAMDAPERDVESNSNEWRDVEVATWDRIERATTGSSGEVDPRLEAGAAAEAEAESTDGLDMSAGAEWPASVLAAARRADSAAAPDPGDANGPDRTRLFVKGLTSVASISTFKGALAHLPGVRSVSVSSGERGMFVFSVDHDPGVDLDSGVASLAGFAAHITDATDDGFTVVAHEPAA